MRVPSRKLAADWRSSGMNTRNSVKETEDGLRAGKPAVASPAKEERPDKRKAEQPSAALKITDPEPLKRRSVAWRDAAQFATVGVFLVLLIAAVELARPILVPVTSALVIGFMLGPLSKRAERYKIPSLVSAIVFWLFVVGALYLIIVTVSGAIIDVADKTPDVGRNIRDKLQVFNRPMAALQDLRNAILPSGSADTGVTVDLLSIATPALTFLTPAVGQIVAFLGTLFFFLLGRTQLRHVIVIFFENRDARLRMLRILNDIETNLTSYLSVVVVINFFVGLAAAAIALLVGLPNAPAWGVLAFILNFIPYIGALIMQVVLFLVGLIVFPTLGQALIAPLLYLVFTTLEGHFITPSIMGKRLFLNPLTVFLALIFWTWLWGPMGAFLAVPLLIMMLVAINHLFPSDDPVLPG
jgi:predicted PurR-regulated permease PerM